ncbi:MAG: alpha/beta hydrolase [Culturomica sp.]|jgi:acetyl esterase/lipase|nr:alpha/beta hydrolase [Culturomica sp.]
MKIVLGIVCLLCCSLLSFGQGRQWTDISYANDSLEGHKLDIYLPADGRVKHKVVVLIYGSAWFANNMKQMAFQAMGKPLLDAGFAVVSINHRSSGDAKFPAQINDVKAAIRFIRGNAGRFGLDTSFIGITGFSSGGHLSSLAGTTNEVKTYKVDDTSMDIEGNVGEYTTFSSNVDAVVDWFGPIDMTRIENCTTTKEANSPEAALIGGAPADHLDVLALLNPMTYIDEKDPKFLVIHGDADNVVPHCQSVFFSDALKEKGRLVEFITVPNGQHGPVTFNEQTFKKMVDFFKKEAAMDDEEVRDMAAYFSPVSKKDAMPDEQGFIRRWLILEPIDKPNRSNTVFTDSYIRQAFGTEYFPAQLSSVLPKDGDQVKVDGRELTWHDLDSKNFNVKLFRFAYGLHKNVYGVLFWVATEVNCTEDMENVRMSVGSNSASMWWLNGKEAVILSGDRRMVKDDCVSPRLNLKKGKNIVWGAVINGPGMSDFCVRFLNEDGEPIRNITISVANK